MFGKVRIKFNALSWLEIHDMPELQFRVHTESFPPVKNTSNFLFPFKTTLITFLSHPGENITNIFYLTRKE